MAKKKYKVFVLAGSLSEGLVYSKILPIINSDEISQVYVFIREKSLELPKCTYITSPQIIYKIPYKIIKIPLRIIFELSQIIYYSFNKKPDLINGIYTIPYGLYSVFIARMLFKKNIVSIIGDEEELKKIGHKYAKFETRINNLVFKISSHITVKGEKTKDYLIKNGIEESKISIFNGSIDEEKFFNKKLERDIDAIFVGAFSELKGPDRFIKIISGLKKYVPSIKAVMAGKGEMFYKIEMMIKEYDLGNNVTLLGYKNNVEDYLNRAKLLFMPSRCEGLSTAMLEAMACGCVPIVSDVGNMTDAAKHEINSLVVKDFQDLDSFIKFAKDVLTQNGKWEKISDSARDTILNYYSVVKQTAVFNNIIKKIFTE